MLLTRRVRAVQSIVGSGYVHRLPWPGAESNQLLTLHLPASHLRSSSGLDEWGSLAAAPCAFSWTWSSVTAELLEAHRLGSTTRTRGMETQSSRAHWTPTPHTTHNVQHPQHTPHCTKKVWYATVLKYEKTSGNYLRACNSNEHHSSLNLMQPKAAQWLQWKLLFCFIFLNSRVNLPNDCLVPVAVFQ